MHRLTQALAYPLSVHMLAGIREVLIITTPDDRAGFERLLGDGSQWGDCSQWGMQLADATQDPPDGLAQAFLIGADFLDGDSASLVLGDNLFYGAGLSKMVSGAAAHPTGATVFGYHVKEPQRQGIVEQLNRGSAWLDNWIDNTTLRAASESMEKNTYGQYLLNLLDGDPR